LYQSTEFASLVQEAGGLQDCQ